MTERDLPDISEAAVAKLLIDLTDGGKWTVRWGSLYPKIIAENGHYVLEPGPYGARHAADATFIAAAPALVRALRAALTKAEQELGTARAAIDDQDEQVGQ